MSCVVPRKKLHSPSEFINMIALETIRASNLKIASTLPSGLVAVFVGATNGVGEATVRQFAKYAPAPRVYLIGRSEEAASRITTECKALNPNGKFTFISKDTSLIRNVDEVCKTIEQDEKSVNLLFLTIATLQTGKSELPRVIYHMQQGLIRSQQPMKVFITLRHWLSMHAIDLSPT
jgi:NAD(P)-dependent dehydrogenase (short-subunit alcohol dehydrogenase family)